MTRFVILELYGWSSDQKGVDLDNKRVLSVRVFDIAYVVRDEELPIYSGDELLGTRGFAIVHFKEESDFKGLCAMSDLSMYEMTRLLNGEK